VNGPLCRTLKLGDVIYERGLTNFGFRSGLHFDALRAESAVLLQIDLASLDGAITAPTWRPKNGRLVGRSVLVAELAMRRDNYGHRISSSVWRTNYHKVGRPSIPAAKPTGYSRTPPGDYIG